MRYDKYISEEKFVPEITYYVSSGTLNLAQLNSEEKRAQMYTVSQKNCAAILSLLYFFFKKIATKFMPICPIAP